MIHLYNWSELTGLEKRGELPETVTPSSFYDCEKVLFLSDLHIPYEDKKVIDQVFRMLEDHRFHRVVINGDLLDFYDLSKFVKDPSRKESLDGEIEEAKKFLARLRAACPDAVIDFNPGNHELRLERYKRTDAPALHGLKCLELPQLLDFEGYNIVGHESEGFLLRPDFLVTHGTVVRAHSGASAKGELEKNGVSGISGHTHRMDAYHKTTLGGSVGWYEQGCLCLTGVEYVTGVPNWQQGLAVGEFDWENQWWLVENVRIVNGVLRYGGKSYS